MLASLRNLLVSRTSAVVIGDRSRKSAVAWLVELGEHARDWILNGEHYVDKLDAVARWLTDELNIDRERLDAEVSVELDQLQIVQRLRVRSDDFLTLRALKDSLLLADQPPQAIQLLQESQEGYAFWRRLSQANIAICSARDAADPVLITVEHYIADRFGSCDLRALNRVVNWLVAEYRLTKDQAEGITLVGLESKLREANTLQPPQAPSTATPTACDDPTAAGAVDTPALPVAGLASSTPPPVESSKSAVEKPAKPPPDHYFQAFRFSLVFPGTQKEMAKELQTQLGRPVDQARISKMLKRVKEFLYAGNILPEVPTLDKGKLKPIDPNRIDLGRREGDPHRAKRQRAETEDSGD
jgi:hypothetical protein